MMKLRSSLYLASAALIAAFAVAQDPVLLRRQLGGAEEVYQVQMDNKMTMGTPMGNQEMIMKGSMRMSLKTDQPDAETGRAPTEMVVSDIKMDLEGLGGMESMIADQLPKEVKMTAKMDARNRVFDMKAEGLDAQAQMMAGSITQGLMFVEFPEGTVRIGDTWEVVVPKNPMIGNEESKMTARLVGERVHEGSPVWIVAMDGTLKINNDMGEALRGQDPTGMGIDMEIVISGTTTMSIEALVDKATGKTELMTTKMEMDQKTDIRNLGMTMDMKSQGTMRIVRQK
jgi:hypothetical protein